jgi:hypothetical protein
MILTVDQIVTAYPSLAELLKHKLPAKVAFDLAILSQRLTPEYKAWATTNDAKVAQYGNGERVLPENMTQFIEEMTPVYAKEVEIQVNKIKIDGLKIEIEPIHLVNLSWLFE